MLLHGRSGTAHMVIPSIGNVAKYSTSPLFVQYSFPVVIQYSVFSIGINGPIYTSSMSNMVHYLSVTGLAG